MSWSSCNVERLANKRLIPSFHVLVSILSGILIGLLVRIMNCILMSYHRRPLSFGFFVEISAGGRYESYLLWTEGRELIFGLLEGLSLTSLISYSPSNHSLSLRIYPVKISRLSKGMDYQIDT